MELIKNLNDNNGQLIGENDSNNVNNDKTNNSFEIASSFCQDYSTGKNQAIIKLLILLHQTGSPIYLFNAIVTICKKYESIEFKITEVPSRKIFLEKLEVLGSSWYDRTYQKLITEPNHQFLVPLIFIQIKQAQICTKDTL